MLKENLSNRPEFVKGIFNFNVKENRFTDKSQKYQFIIQFFSDNNKTPHKITKIQQVVLAKAPLLFKIDETKTPSGIKKSKNYLFNAYLQDLKNWGLLHSIPAKKDKDDGDTKEYQLSKFGKMFALLIETRLSENKQKTCDKLFDHLKSYWSDYSSSLDLFCMSYLGKCKDNGLFNEFIGFYTNSLIFNDTLYIKSIHDLFTQMILVRFDDKQKNQTLLNLWKESYKELDEKTRQLFSNHMKIHLNRMTLRNVQDYHKFELKRLNKICSDDWIIVEACCSGCLSNFQYIATDIIYYISYIFIQSNSFIERRLKDLRCNKCVDSNFDLVVNI